MTSLFRLCFSTWNAPRNTLSCTSLTFHPIQLKQTCQKPATLSWWFTTTQNLSFFFTFDRLVSKFGISGPKRAFYKTQHVIPSHEQPTISPWYLHNCWIRTKLLGASQLIHLGSTLVSNMHSTFCILELEPPRGAFRHACLHANWYPRSVNNSMWSESEQRCVDYLHKYVRS